MSYFMKSSQISDNNSSRQVQEGVDYHSLQIKQATLLFAIYLVMKLPLIKRRLIVD